MNDQDRAVRSFVYTHFIETQRAPTVVEIADQLSLSLQDTEGSLKRLEDAHVLVLEINRPEIRMAMPFSGVPTRFRVNVGRCSWWANCAWDAFGILAALHSDGEVVSACPDCNRSIVVRVEESKVPRGTELIHFAVPASRWWDDFDFTWATILLFRSDEHLRNWCKARRLDRGESISLQQAWRLAKAWYHDRLHPDFRRKSTAEAQEVFSQLGFHAPFWNL